MEQEPRSGKGDARCAITEDNATKLEYIKAMLEYYKDDARQDYVRVTGTLALAAIFVTQVPIPQLRRLDHLHTLLLFAGLGCLVLAAGAYFSYVQGTHLARRCLSRHLLDLNACEVKSEAHNLFRSWDRVGRIWAGNLLFGAGVVLLGDVLWVLVASSS
jgi:hypothetical protein